MGSKIRPILGQIYFFSQIFIMFYHFYLYYYVIETGNIYILTYLIALFVAQIFAKRSQTFVKFGLWFRPLDFFTEAKVIQEDEVEDKNTMLIIHPHGIFTFGLLLNLNQPNTPFQNLIALGSRFALYSPFGGLLLKLWGVDGVNPSNLEKHLQKGQNVSIVPGGFEEATLSCVHENRLYLKKRKGFIKYALKYGQNIHPVFTFGENQLYHTLDKWIKFRLWLNKYKIITTLFWSKYTIFPNMNGRLVTVIGKKIKLPRIENPSKDDVSYYHYLYMDELIKMYQRHSNGEKLRIY